MNFGFARSNRYKFPGARARMPRLTLTESLETVASGTKDFRRAFGTELPSVMVT